jgi:hypothetical protein
LAPHPNLTAITAMSLLTAPADSVPGDAPAGPFSPDGAAMSVPPAAFEAVAVVDAFVTALAVGRTAWAGRFLDPGVVVVIDGQVQGSRADYLAHRAGADAALRHGAQRRLRRRQARAGTALAWVVSENVWQDAADARVETETMVLGRTPGGWKILHIHWSSHARAGH